MIVWGAEARRIRQARLQPSLHFTVVHPDAIVEEVRRLHLPTLAASPDWYFVDQGPLACIDADSGTIYVHNVLNHADSPTEVLRFIAKHELLHLIVSPSLVAGRMKDHPPEFWHQERAIAPEGSEMWAWIWLNLGSCLWSRPRLGQLDVRPNWRKIDLSKRVTASPGQRLPPDMQFM